MSLSSMRAEAPFPWLPDSSASRLLKLAISFSFSALSLVMSTSASRYGIPTGTNRTVPEDSLLSLTQTWEDTLPQYDLLSINSFGSTIWTLTSQFISGSLELFVVVLGVVDVANILVLNGFVDGTVHSCAEETLFEKFGGRGEVTRVLLVT